jgi:hypothetical protein
MSRCGCLADGNRHPQFVCLYQVKDKAGTMITMATNPFLREWQLNGLVEGLPPKKGAPDWRLELAIGPLTKGASEVEERWSQNRTAPSRLVAGVQLARALVVLVREQRLSGTPQQQHAIAVEAGKDVTMYVRKHSYLNSVLESRQTQLSKRVKLC